MTEEQLREIELRCDKATPGPCEVVRFDNEGGSISYQVETQIGPNHKILGWHDDLQNPKARHDAEFEARARTDIPALCKEVRRLRSELDEYAHKFKILNHWPAFRYALGLVIRRHDIDEGIKEQARLAYSDTQKLFTKHQDLIREIEK